MKYILLTDVPGWGYGGAMIALLLLAVLLLVLLGFLAFSAFEQRLYGRKDTNVRIYSYDYAKKTFFFFDRANLRHRKTMTEKEFLAQFQPADSYQVKNWLDDIASGKNHREFYQADVKIRQRGRSMPSILELTGVNYEKCVIHFESHLLSFAATLGTSSKRRRAKHMLSSPEEAEDFLSASDPNRLCAVYYVSFYCPDKEIADRTIQETEKVAASCLDVLSAYLGKSRKLLAITGSDFVLVDTATMSKAMAMQLASSIETKMRQNINRAFADTKIRFAIGLSTGTFFQKDFRKAREQCQLMAEAVKKTDYNDDILFYDQDFFQRERKRREDKEDVRMLVKNRTYRLYFLPTIDIRSFQSAFYILDVVPYGTDVRDYFEILRIAGEIKDGSESLFRSIRAKLEETIKDSAERVPVLLPLPYTALNAFNKTISHNDSKKFDLTLALRESDLLPYLASQRQVMDRLNDLKRRGFHLAIHIANASSLLPNKLLLLFSYILVGKEFTSNLTDPNALNSLQLIETDYIKLKIPIVYAGLEKCNMIELCAHYGGDIFQCAELAMPSSRPERIDDEAIEELKKNLR